MPGKCFVNCYVEHGIRARIAAAARQDGVGVHIWMHEALMGALRVSEQVHRRQPRWDPITEVTPGMTEITASLVEPKGE